LARLDYIYQLLFRPREYGGVAIIWRENIDHLIKILPDGTERIQCVEINSNNDTKFVVASVYLPSKGSHDSNKYFFLLFVFSLLRSSFRSPPIIILCVP
jgi:exonuclease III